MTVNHDDPIAALQGTTAMKLRHNKYLLTTSSVLEEHADENNPPTSPPPFTEPLNANEQESVSLKAVQQQKDQMLAFFSPEAPCFNQETSLIGLYCLKETGLNN